MLMRCGRCAVERLSFLRGLHHAGVNLMLLYVNGNQFVKGGV